MTTPANSSGEQPGNETVNADPAGAQPQEKQEAQSFDDYSEDQLLAAISGEEIPDDEAPSPDPKAEDPKEEPEKETPEEPKAKEKEEDPDDEPQGKEDGSKPPSRVSVRVLPPNEQLETAQALEMVRNGEAKDLLEAIQAIRGHAEEQQPGQEQEEETPQAKETKPEPEQNQEVATIEAEIKELRAQRVAAKKDFDTDVEAELTDKIEDALTKLSEARINAAYEARQQARQQETFNDQYQSAVEEMESRYPDVLDDNSKMSRWLEDRLTAAEARNEADLSDPRYILKLADEVAETLGVKPAGKSDAPIPAKVDGPPTPPRRGTAADVAPDHSSRARTTDEQARAMIEDSDPDTILQALTR